MMAKSSSTTSRTTGSSPRPATSSPTQATARKASPSTWAACRQSSISRAEWNQMYRETWRIERDFFYDPNMHGLTSPKSKPNISPTSPASPRATSSLISARRCWAKSKSATCSSEARVPPANRPKSVCSARTTSSRTTATNSPRLQRAKLDARPHRATHPARHQHPERRLPPRRQRPRTPRDDNLYSFFDGTAGKQTVINVGYKPDSPTGTMSLSSPPTTNPACATSTGSTPTSTRSISSPVAKSPTSTCPTRLAPATTTSIAISMRRSASRDWCSTSATTRAARWPTTSSMSFAETARRPHRARRRARPRSPGRNLRPQGHDH